MLMLRTFITICATGALCAGDAGGPPPGRGEGGPPGGQRMGPPPEEMFKNADANGDGKVTLEELTAALEKKRGEMGGRRNEERGKIFTKMDANGDGMVSKEEFLAFEPPAPPGQEGKEGNKDGGKEGARRGPDPAELFKRLDRNGDGVITQDDLPKRPVGPGKDGGKDGGEGREGKEGKEGNEQHAPRGEGPPPGH
ncbi:MAG: EF-hand domain-containing protein [Planctomycetota bacterium]